MAQANAHLCPQRRSKDLTAGPIQFISTRLHAIGGIESHAADLAASFTPEVFGSVPEHMANSQVLFFLGELYSAMHAEAGNPDLHSQVVQAVTDLSNSPLPPSHNCPACTAYKTCNWQRFNNCRAYSS
jgi:hypothetical protein